MSDNKQSTDERIIRVRDRARSEDVAHSIGRRIVAGQPPPGGFLPTEHELCAELGVSRAALREGFRLLSARGMILGRRKVGTVVRPISDWNMLDASVLAWHLEQEPTETFIAGLFEARSIIEPAAAGMAASRASPAQMNEMQRAMQEMIGAQGAAQSSGAHRATTALMAESLDKTVGADLRFHKAILAAGGNNFLATFGALIGSSLSASFRLNWHAHNSPPAMSLELHKDVLTAIVARQPSLAESNMRRLLTAAEDDAKRALAFAAAPGPRHRKM